MLFLMQIQKPSAFVVALLYLVGVFGFDVHWSEDSRQTYIVPLFAGIECNNSQTGP